MEPPLDRSTTWPYVDGEPGPFHYARNAHPVGVEAERQLGELDGGEALLFRRGWARRPRSCWRCSRPGSTIALAQRRVLRDWRPPHRARALGRSEHVLFDQTGHRLPACRACVWIEAPSNPLHDDARLRGRRSSPRPRRLRRDRGDADPPRARSSTAAISSSTRATKYLAGHHDVLLGRGRVRSAEARRARLHELRTRTGIVAAPDAAWLLLRGLKTLRCPQCSRQSRSRRTLARARWRTHEAVQRTCAIPVSAALHLVRRRRRRSSRGRVETSTRLIVNATSLGGVHLRRSRRATAGKATASQRACCGSPSASRPADAALARPRQAALETGVTTTGFTSGRPLIIAREWA